MTRTATYFPTAFDAEAWAARATAELKEHAFADGANPDLAGLWAERTALIGTLDTVADRLPDLLSRNPAAARKVIKPTGCRHSVGFFASRPSSVRSEPERQRRAGPDLRWRSGSDRTSYNK